MPVLINFKICDNAPVCDGITACPTGALYYDFKNSTIAYDEKKCIKCGSCVVCPAGAIHFAYNQEEYDKIKKELDADPRKVSDLFVQRYGGDPKTDPFLLTEKEFPRFIKKYPKKTVLEVLDLDNIVCLSDCLTVKELFENFEFVRYRKMVVDRDSKFVEKYKIKKLPSLLFFENEVFLGKIEGFYGLDQKSQLIKKISKHLKQI